MEIWKPIADYEEYYEISNLGRVKSLPRTIVKSNGVIQNRKERIRKLSKDKDGYLIVGLNLNGTSVKKHVHTLVAEAFLDGKFNGAEVNHRDFDRTNNCSDNLEWVSHRDNVSYTIKANRHISQKMIFEELQILTMEIIHFIKDTRKIENTRIKSNQDPAVEMDEPNL